jgi:hypothetical protein
MVWILLLVFFLFDEEFKLRVHAAPARQSLHVTKPEPRHVISLVFEESTCSISLSLCLWPLTIKDSRTHLQEQIPEFLLNIIHRSPDAWSRTSITTPQKDYLGIVSTSRMAIE